MIISYLILSNHIFSIYPSFNRPQIINSSFHFVHHLLSCQALQDQCKETKALWIDISDSAPNPPPTQSKWETGETSDKICSKIFTVLKRPSNEAPFKRTSLSSRKNWGHWSKGRWKEVLYQCLWKTHRSTANLPCPPWGLQPSSVLLLVWLPATTALRGITQEKTGIPLLSEIIWPGSTWSDMTWYDDKHWQTTSFIIFLSIYITWTSKQRQQSCVSTLPSKPHRTPGGVVPSRSTHTRPNLKDSDKTWQTVIPTQVIQEFEKKTIFLGHHQSSIINHQSSIIIIIIIIPSNNGPKNIGLDGIYRYGCFLKWWYPQIIHFNRVFRYKPSILGYPYFRKPPYPWICTKPAKTPGFPYGRQIIHATKVHLARLSEWWIFFSVASRKSLSLLDQTLARKNDSPTWCGVIVVVWCYCGGVVLLW